MKRAPPHRHAPPLPDAHRARYRIQCPIPRRNRSRKSVRKTFPESTLGSRNSTAYLAAASFPVPSRLSRANRVSASRHCCCRRPAISRALWRETVRSEGQVSGLPNSRAGRRATHRTRCRCGQRIINTRQHRAVHFRRGITGAGSFARFPHQCGGAELVTGLHHRPVHSIGADRTEQAGLGHCGFGADHRLADR